MSKALVWVTNCGPGELPQYIERDPIPAAGNSVTIVKARGEVGAYKVAPEGAKCSQCERADLLFPHPKMGFLCSDHLLEIL